MDRETKERWLVLCEQAAVEQDPARLLALVTEINRLLEEKEQRGETKDRAHLQRLLAARAKN
jgi:hypothetical protein